MALTAKTTARTCRILTVSGNHGTRDSVSGSDCFDFFCKLKNKLKFKACLDFGGSVKKRKIYDDFSSFYYDCNF